jgi:hypothetical protein
MSLRKQDHELLKQLTSLNEHIQDLKEIAKLQGGIYGSNEDREDFKQPLPSTTPTSPNGPTTEPSSTKGKKSAKKEREKNAETPTKERLQKIAKNELNTAKRIKNDIQGLQETSFEYTEVPCDTTTARAVRSKATAKRSQSTTIADVSRKKVSSLRLERKSLSCQFLDSGGRDESNKGKKSLFAESHEALASTGRAKRTRPLSQIETEKSTDANHANTKQKSLSLSQLRPKNTEGSTSDSECSTSGCYGGSSTGSDVELERGYFITRTGNESNEKLDKLFELNSLNLKPFGKRHLAIGAQGQFRKKIVSV